MAIRANIRLCWKGLPETKATSLLRTFVNYGIKKFYNIGPKCNLIVFKYWRASMMFVVLTGDRRHMKRTRDPKKPMITEEMVVNDWQNMPKLER